MAHIRRSRLTLVVCALGVLLLSATSTAKLDCANIRDADHCAMIWTIREYVDSEFHMRDKRMDAMDNLDTRVVERQNVNTALIQSLDARVWGILVALVLGIAVSFYNGRLAKLSAKAAVDAQASIQETLEKVVGHHEWDGQERRRHRRLPPVDDRMPDD